MLIFHLNHQNGWNWNINVESTLYLWWKLKDDTLKQHWFMVLVILVEYRFLVARVMILHVDIELTRKLNAVEKPSSQSWLGNMIEKSWSYSWAGRWMKSCSVDHWGCQLELCCLALLGYNGCGKVVKSNCWVCDLNATDQWSY